VCPPFMGAHRAPCDGPISTCMCIKVCSGISKHEKSRGICSSLSQSCGFWRFMQEMLSVRERWIFHATNLSHFYYATNTRYRDAETYLFAQVGNIFTDSLCRRCIAWLLLLDRYIVSRASVLLCRATCGQVVHLLSQWRQRQGFCRIVSCQSRLQDHNAIKQRSCRPYCGTVTLARPSCSPGLHCITHPTIVNLKSIQDIVIPIKTNPYLSYGLMGKEQTQANVITQYFQPPATESFTSMWHVGLQIRVLLFRNHRSALDTQAKPTFSFSATMSPA
jgi:hypothetical protein